SAAARFASRASTARTKVLIVEDDADLRRMLVEALESDGAEVWDACDGAVAERMLFDDGRRFDVVVTDIRMPGRTGLDVLRGLRARGSTIPVVLMSGFADGAAIAEQTASQRALLFSKPFDIDDLRTAVLNIEAAVRAPPPASCTI
ncbi:MAG TPA: response regulator, partial [Labilithrix sp.]|nr:response regulator [Labilithrix sp.]